jgi:hypothetical protein
MKHKIRQYKNSIIALFIPSLFFMLTGCQQFGANPAGTHVDVIKRSSNYDAKEGIL